MALLSPELLAELQDLMTAMKQVREQIKQVESIQLPEIIPEPQIPFSSIQPPRGVFPMPDAVLYYKRESSSYMDSSRLSIPSDFISTYDVCNAYKRLPYFLDNVLPRSTYFARVQIARSFIKCLQQLHARGIVHNVLQTSSFAVPSFTSTSWKLLTNLDDVRLLDERIPVACFDPASRHLSFVAPEIATLQTLHAKFDQDVFALGVVFFHLFTGRSLFEHNDDVSSLYQRFHQHEVSQASAQVNPLSAMWMQQVVLARLNKLLVTNPLVRDLLCRMLAWNPVDRFNLSQVSGHALFAR